jgi:CheY-like chemotaxis protein
MSPSVLVVEDEDTLRTSIVRGLSRHLSVPVHGAGTLTEALSIIDEHPPTVILCDLDLPDRAGIEILGELGRRGLHAAVTFVSAYTRAFLAQIPKHAGVRVLEKPVTIEQLRTLVREDLAQHSGDAPSPFGVADYLQLAAMGGHSVLIEVGHKQGKIIVLRGELFSAYDSFGEARALDERRRDGLSSDPQELRVAFSEAAPPAPIAVVEPAVDPAAERFSQLMEDGLSALLTRQYPDAWRAFRAASEINPTDRTVQANLARLRELGFGKDPSEN